MPQITRVSTTADGSLLPSTTKSDEAANAPEEIWRVVDAGSGLVAFIVIDSTRRGPAAGGTRTARYESEGAALADARALAGAMTIKCAIAGLDAGGAKAVIVENALRDRPAAFAAYGEAVESLNGRFRTAGDFGTTTADLARVATTTSFVHGATDDDSDALARAVARTVTGCARAAGATGRSRVAVSGVGAMGAAVARAFAAWGCPLHLADLSLDRVETLARDLGAATLDANAAWVETVDVLAPCAKGGLLDVATARTLGAKIVCGAANCLTTSLEAERIACERAVVVPDVLSSSGAVIVGIAQSVMQADPTPLLDAVEDTCRTVLEHAARDDVVPSQAAYELARSRLR